MITLFDTVYAGLWPLHWFTCMEAGLTPLASHGIALASSCSNVHCGIFVYSLGLPHFATTSLSEGSFLTCICATKLRAWRRRRLARCVVCTTIPSSRWFSNTRWRPQTSEPRCGMTETTFPLSTNKKHRHSWNLTLLSDTPWTAPGRTSLIRPWTGRRGLARQNEL